MKGIKHRNPTQTKNNNPRWKAYSIEQLEDALGKSSTPKIKEKIRIELERKKSAVT